MCVLPLQGLPVTFHQGEVTCQTAEMQENVSYPTHTTFTENIQKTDDWPLTEPVVIPFQSFVGESMNRLKKSVLASLGLRAGVHYTARNERLYWWVKVLVLVGECLLPPFTFYVITNAFNILFLENLM